MQAATGGYARGMSRLDAQSSQSQNSDPHVSDSHEGEKQPRTERGRRTMRKLIDAAEVEFAENGFHQASIVGITRRAGVALGSFYTYFDTKEAIFRALVRDLGQQVKTTAREAISTETKAMEIERAALAAFLRFARENKEIYRIIDESEFIDPAIYRDHYETTAKRIFERLERGMASGELRDDLSEVHAWAIMGMNVFLGLKFSLWSETDRSDEVAAAANLLMREGIAAPASKDPE